MRRECTFTAQFTEKARVGLGPQALLLLSPSWRDDKKTVNREQLNRKSGERERKRRRKIGAWRPERIYSKSNLLARGNNTTRQLTENISVV